MAGPTAQEIARYYRWLLDREPEPAVLADYKAAEVSRMQLVRTIVSSDEFTSRLQRMDAPASVREAPQEPGLGEDAFWRRYVPFWNADSPVPFREVEFQTYQVLTPSGDLTIKSMLSSLELSLLFALAKDHWSGVGEIVDLGCLYGLTTRCFAEGMRRNGRVPDAAKSRRIYAYDLFLAEDYGWWSLASPTVHAGSWFPEFLNVNRDLEAAIVPCPGDLLRMNWGQNPIEILMIDASKSWDLNDWILKNMFTRLIPGQSIVIQQDLVHYVEYWLIITMEYFADKFEFINTIYGSTAYYRCKDAISNEEVRINLNSLSFAEKERLLLAGIARNRPSAQAALQGCYAKLLFDNGQTARARAVLQNMDVSRQSDDAAYDFSGIARHDRDTLLNLLAQEGV